MPTKSEVRERIAQIGKCRSLRKSHPDEYVFFRELFQNHPEAERKRVAEITDIFIRVGYGGVYQLGYQLPGQVRDTISWVSCVTGRSKSVSQKLTRAMRHAIIPSMRAFRDTQPQHCVLCSSRTDLTVDHFPRKFCDIRDAFLDETEYPYPVEFAKTSQALDCFRPDDFVFQQEWVAFHDANATYRILCSTCNLRTETNGDISSAPSNSV